MRVALKNCQGIAMVVVMMMLLLLLSISGASLLFSGLNLKASSNLKTGGAGLHIADAGVQHALAVIPSGSEFDSFLAGTFLGTFACASPCDGTNKPTLTGSLSGYTYSVVAEDDSDGGTPAATDDTNRLITITSTANGPNSSVRKVKAYIGRSGSSWAPPGAVYIPGGSTSDADFTTGGSAFRMDGNDTNYSADSNNDGRADSISPGPKSPVYGVAALYDSMVTEFINSLTSTEKTQVQGKGYNGATSPATPSVFKTSTSFSVTELANAFKALALPSNTYNSGMQLTSSICPPRPPEPTDSRCKLGTDTNPQITYINASTGTTLFGTGSTVTGSGVLILDGKANVFGNFEFHGIVISLAAGPRGDESVESNLKFKLKDNARILGTVLLGPTGDDLKFDIKGNAAIYYSSQAINLVQTNWGSYLPQPAKLIAWHELMN